MVRADRTAPNPRILVVEDSKDIQDLILILLKGEGYEMTYASNGQEALEILRSSSELPAVIFLDLIMPVMDGAQFIKEIEKDERLSQIPVVVMSAYREDEVKRMDLGERLILRKPVEAEELIEVAERCASSQRGSEQSPWPEPGLDT